MKTQAKRNADMKAARNNILALIALGVFAILGSLSLDAHAAETQPRFEDQVAFTLHADDQSVYRAQYGWCMPTPGDEGVQCYVLASDLVGYLGAGDVQQVKNLRTYGDVKRGLTPVTQLPAAVRDDALRSFRAVWGN